MKEKYRILHLEDVAIDAEIVKRELKKNKIDFDYLLVDSETDYINALNDFRPDVILCDHSLPAFSSLEALAIVKKRKLNIPFIVITGLTAEDAAIARVTEGADDYILKDRLKRLPHAIINAIEKSRLEKEKEHLLTDAKVIEASSEELLAQLSDKLLLTSKVSGIGIWEYLFKEKKFIADEVLLSQYGITPAEFKGTMDSWMQYVHPEDKDRIREEFQNAMDTLKDFTTEFKVVWPDNSIHYINGIAIVQYDKERNPLRFIGTNQDITERKKGEEKIRESESRYRLLIEHATDAICIADANMKFVDINPYGCEVFGYSLEEALQLSLPDILFIEDLAGNPIKMHELKLGKTVRNERRLRRKDGTAIDMEVSTKLMEDGTLIMFGHDITTRKRTEQRINESEAKFRAFFENSIDGILLTLTDGKIISANPAACEIFRMTEEEICAVGKDGIIDINDTRAEQLFTEHQLNGSAKGELTYLRKDTSRFPGEISSVSFKDSYGLERTSLIIRDISKRKTAEEKLAATADELEHAVNDLSKIMDSSLDIICTIDEDGKFATANAAVETILGYKAFEIIGKKFIELVFSEDVEVTLTVAAGIMNGTPVTMFENRYIRKDGGLVPLLWSARWDDEDKLMYCIAKDATEKKQLEKALKGEQLRLNDLFSQAPTSMGILKGANHVFEIANPPYLALIGKKDIIGKTVKEILPEIVDQGFINLLDHVYKTGETFSANEMLIRINQSGTAELVDKYLNFIYQAYKNIEGKIEGVFFFAIDVTEQVVSRKKIEESENRFRGIIEKSTDMKTLSTINGEFIYVSPSATKLFGYSSKEILNTSAFNIIHPDDIGEFAAKRNTILQTPGKSVSGRQRMRHKNGNWIWCEGIITNMLAEPGINAIVANFRDISEKIAGEEQKEFDSNNLNALINNTSDLMWSVDTDYKLITFNEPFCDTIKLMNGKKVAKGDSVFSLISSPEQAIHFKIIYERALGGEAFTELEYINSPAESWSEISYYPIRKGDEVMGVACHSRDLTSITKAKLEDEFKAKLLNTIGQAVIATDLNGIINFWNKAAEQLYGWSHEEAMGKNVINMAPAKENMHAVELMEYLSNGNAWSGEFAMQHKNGRIFPVFVTNSPIYDQHQKLAGVIGVSSDISERKAIEAQIKESEQRYRTLFEQNLAGFYQSNAAGELINCNEAFANMLKYDSPEELLKVNANELYFKKEHRDYFIQNVIQRKKLLNHEGVLKCKDGSALYFLENISEQKDPETGIEFFDGILIDVTEKKLAELQLSESNERFKNVSKATSDAIWDWNLVDKTIYWGEGLQKIFGYNPSELKNNISSWQAHIHPQDYDRVIKKVYESVDGTDLNWEDEYRYLKKDQTYARVIDRGFIIRDDQGKGVRMVGAMQDVTEKKAMEDLLDKATSLARIGGWELNLVENTLLWSGFTSHLHEVESDFFPDLASGINFYKEGHSRNLITLKVEKAIEDGTPWDEELQIITAKGNERWVRCIGNSEIIDGKCIKLFGSFQDINERKIAELSALAVLNEKNTILESIGDAFFAVDENWTVTYWNKEAEKMLVRSKKDIVGHNFWDVFPDWINSQSHQKFQQAVDTRQAVSFEVNYVPLSKWYEAIAYPSNNGLSVYFKDVTQRKNSDIQLNTLNKNLQKQARALTQSNEELEQFAYVASHDLQEPLRMVSSFLTLLEKKYGNVIDDTGKKYIDFAVDGAGRMRQIILDLLEFSRASRIEHELENVDANKVVEGIKILLRKQMEDKNAVFLVDKLPVISSYQTPVRQIFQNLISNALKYSHKDIPCKIQISVTKLKANWQFAIKDNGIGIAEEYFDKIFLIFQRLHSKAEFSGTGLGLAVTKKIIENLGGKIWVESKEGKGSTFYFTLPKN